MDEDEKTNRFLDWLGGNAGGRKLLKARDWYRERYDLHIKRYRSFDQGAYRWYTRLVSLAASLLVLAVLAGMFRVGLLQYRHYVEKRRQQQAQEFLAHGDYRNASLSARQVLTLNPNNVTACRVMAELADRIRSPVTLEWLQRVVQNEPTVENKLILASAGLNYQKPPFPLTVQILEELAPAAANRAGYQVVAGNLAMHNARLAEAEARYETAVRLEPTNRLFRMTIAVLKLSATNQTEQVQSRAILEQMRADESIGLLALRALVVDRLLHKDAAAANAYSSQLITSPRATLPDKLQNLDILQRLKSAEFSDRLQTVQQQVATNALAVRDVAAWMQANGLVAESLDWLTGLPIALLDQMPVQMALAQGYLQSSQWASLLKITDQSNWGDLEFLRSALAFRALSQMGVVGVADSSWNTAMSKAAYRHEALNQLLQLAESWRLPHKKEAVLLQIVEQFPEERRARQELETSFFNSGNTMGLRQLYLSLNTHFPDETAYKNDLAFTSLLLKIDVRKAGQQAAETYAKDPNNPTKAATYALALHMQGRDKQGLAVLQKLPLEELAQPSVALYYGVLLAAIKKTDEALPWLRIAQTKGRLLPEEKELLSTALGNGNPPPP